MSSFISSSIFLKIFLGDDYDVYQHCAIFRKLFIEGFTNSAQIYWYDVHMVNIYV